MKQARMGPEMKSANKDLGVAPGFSQPTFAVPPFWARIYAACFAHRGACSLSANTGAAIHSAFDVTLTS